MAVRVTVQACGTVQMQCKSKVCHLVCRHEAALEKVRAEGRSSAESARGNVVEPLKEEVECMRQQLEEAQAMYEVCTHEHTSAIVFGKSVLSLTWWMKCLGMDD